MKRVFCLITLAAFLFVCLPSAGAAGVSASGELTFETPLDASDASFDALLHFLDELKIGYAYAEQDGCFDLYTVLQLKDAPRTATDIVLYGTPAHWGLWVPKLGETRLMLNNEAMVEFGLKMWNHLSLPLHRPALLYPWVHEAALAKPKAAWDMIFHASEGTRAIPYEALLSLAEELAELSENDAAFSTYLSALGEATGLGESLTAVFWSLPDWIGEEFPDGLVITEDERGERWQAAGTEDPEYAYTPYERTPDGGWRIYGLGLLGGDTVSLERKSEGDGFSLELCAGDGSGTLHAVLTADAVSLQRLRHASLTLSGDALAGRIFPCVSSKHIASEPMAEGDERIYTLTSNGSRLTLADGSGNNLLVIHNKAISYTPDRWPAYLDIEIQGVNFFSLNDSSLEELVHTLLIPAVKAAVPVIAAAPAESVAALMNWAEQTGLLGE